MSLADTVAGEQKAVANGHPACQAVHPFDGVDATCVRIVHLPQDTVHAGFLADVLIQWED